MYIPEKMMVNKFIDVAIPSTKMLFSRLGEAYQTVDRFSGDEVVPMPQSKIDTINDYMQYAAEEAAKLNKSE